MARIYNTSGELYTKKGNERVRVEHFEAPTSDCDCGIFCCGNTKVLRWYDANNVKKEITLDALYALVNPLLDPLLV